MMLSESTLPLISIIMPAYNTAGFIGRAIVSVQEQTYPHWELWVINDGSKDNTGAVIQEYASQDPRIRYLPIANLGKAGMVRNVGLKQAQGELIAFLDSDDAYEPKALETLFQAFQADPKTQVAYAFQCTVDEQDQMLDPNPIGLIQSENGNRLDASAEPNWVNLLFGNIPFNYGALMIRKSTQQGVGLIDEDLKFAEDKQYQLRLYAHALRDSPAAFKVLPEITFRYRIRANSVTHTYDTASVTDQMAHEARFVDWVFAQPELPDEIRALRSRMQVRTYRRVAGSKFGFNQQPLVRAALRYAWNDPHVRKQDWLKNCGVLYLRSHLPQPVDRLVKKLLTT